MPQVPSHAVIDNKTIIPSRNSKHGEFHFSVVPTESHTHRDCTWTTVLPPYFLGRFPTRLLDLNAPYVQNATIILLMIIIMKYYYNNNIVLIRSNTRLIIIYITCRKSRRICRCASTVPQTNRDFGRA